MSSRPSSLHPVLPGEGCYVFPTIHSEAHGMAGLCTARRWVLHVKPNEEPMAQERAEQPLPAYMRHPDPAQHH